MKKYQYVTVLTIAGSDSGGGAGIQADLKTFASLGCFGTSAITAITVQNTVGVKDIHSIPVNIVAGQIRAVMDDLKPSAIKIGMVHSAELASAIANTLKDYRDVPVILDPVMVATSGDRLIQKETVEVLKKELFPLATLVTPNLDEAEILSGMEVRSPETMEEAAHLILQTGCNAVLVKGGHLKRDTLQDIYLDRMGTATTISSAYIDTNNTHGTGCTLSSAIASFVARGLPLAEAVLEAGKYVHQAIAEGSDVKTGEGNGPLNHFFDPQSQIKI
ncbi:bifunctional hydroxymethylpyrimidine kinase/phosphomethylpyrimidine kinase [Pararcticibacter amylolyticus]|uniref:hydroxymethylpyrimidine kinase n=1 Tax=Pararcticibacter amylolyticus TaxID=2173175 RepID=A0A2U2PJT3_9SPHI|nr:bifunctional hydroxymethylpyrimidine kinase/phosphomethylpyrimidine kinase [Pararcticibacter amylolyticus]PWG81667.1 bifunctional hydroxymethylpyrimidine kinase/phosphomethylpyrimidine kinase [Pararcticibacter amylolyticus]